MAANETILDSASPSQASWLFPVKTAKGPVLSNHPILHLDGGVALVDAVGVEVFGRDRAGGEDSMGADGDAGTDESACANPCSPFHPNWPGDEVEVRGFVVMVAGAEKRALGNAHMRLDGHRCQIQDKDFLAEPDMVAERQPPGKPDGAS